MQRDPRYDILFEPVRIGPVTARRTASTRCLTATAWAMRCPRRMQPCAKSKAEGGWAVVSTEECEIHPSGDVSPFIEARLWDDHDIPALTLMCEKVHAHGALAAVELTHNGPTASNLYSREVALAPSHQPLKYGYPHQARAMTRADIRDYRRWHRDAALRAKRAGFDIVYVYAAHDLSLAMHFLQQRRNHRTDEYGGSLENRVRLLRELIEDTKDAVGDSCAVAVRFATEEFLGVEGVSESEAREIVHLLADLPDLWDVNIAAWYMDSQTSRFAREGYQEPFTHWVRQITRKPVVGVGRFTSPDTMVSQIRRGVLDLIGAARPSIADPFLPKKIEQGPHRRYPRVHRLQHLRDRRHDHHADPLHAESDHGRGVAQGMASGAHRAEAAATSGSSSSARGLPGWKRRARLGSVVMKCISPKRRSKLGGRVNLESRLPGLAEWARVRDWRLVQINKMPNVTLYRDNRLTAEDVLSFGAERVVLATGCHWRRDGYGRSNGSSSADSNTRACSRPMTSCAAQLPDGPVLLFDDDSFYIGSVLAETLRAAGREVIYVTPDDTVASWTIYTHEYRHIQKRLREIGVRIVTGHNIVSFDATAQSRSPASTPASGNRLPARRSC